MYFQISVLLFESFKSKQILTKPNLPYKLTSYLIAKKWNFYDEIRNFRKKVRSRGIFLDNLFSSNLSVCIYMPVEFLHSRWVLYI